MSNFEESDFELPIPLAGTDIPAVEGLLADSGSPYFDVAHDPEDAPAFKNFPFALSPYPEDSIGIEFGTLIAQANNLIFEDGEYTDQTGVDDPQVFIPEPFLDLEEGRRFKRVILPWRGAVYLYWETDDTGNVTLCDLRPADQVQSVPLPLDPDAGETVGKFNVKIGYVPPVGDKEVLQTEQDISADFYWIISLAIEESSSSSSSSDSDGGGGDPDPSDSGDSDDSGSDKSTAIVPMDWHEKGYGALFTMESNEVLFEFVLRDLDISGRKTVHSIDNRFLKVCDPDTLVVAGAPCGDKAGSVGAVVDGSDLILSSSAIPFLRPNKVTLKLTGVRKGFSHMDMPERSRAQFVANEKFINSAYPRE